MSVVRMWEIVKRAETGQFIEEKDFLMKHFIPTMRKVIKKYEIKYDSQIPVTSDDDLADRVWQAALEFFLEVGIYHQDTHRVIKFSEEEVKEALFATPSEYMVGEGADIRRFGSRKIEDSRPPFMLLSPDITYDEHDHLSACIAFLKEPLLDGLCAPILDQFMGRKIKSPTPSELGGSAMHAMNLREAARLVGRPGAWFVAVGTAESDMAQIAVSDDMWGVRHTDGRLVGAITEFMTNSSMLNKATHYQMNGNIAGCLAGAIYGGYAGGAEGTAILEVAYHLMGLMVYFAQFTQNFPFHLRYGSNTGREMLWITSIYSQAIARNTHLVQTSNGFANAGPGTEMLFYETAAHAIASAACGANLWEIAPARNKVHNYGTPLECRFAAEVGHSVTKMNMTREKANEIVNKLLNKYENDIPTAPEGKPFQKLYDMKELMPTQEYLDQYYKVKEDIAKMGIDFIY